MKKRWLALFLAVAIVCGLLSGLSFTAAAEDGVEQLYSWYVDIDEQGFATKGMGEEELHGYMNSERPMFFSTDSAGLVPIPMDSLYFVPDVDSMASMDVHLAEQGYWDLRQRAADSWAPA